MNLTRHLALDLVAVIGLTVAGTSALAQTQTPTQSQTRAAKSAPAASAATQDQADIDRSQIIGNRELPKVLYIVPWKKPGPGDLTGRPLNSVMDDALSPLDRDVFRRQVNYDTQTTAKTAAQAPAAPAPPAK